MKVLLGGPKRQCWWEEVSGEHCLHSHGEPMDVTSPGSKGTNKSSERSLLKKDGGMGRRCQIGTTLKGALTGSRSSEGQMQKHRKVSQRVYNP